MSIDNFRRETRNLLGQDFNELDEQTVGYILITPLLVLLLGLYLYPVVRAIWFSFHEINLFLTDSTFLGVSHYIELIQSPRFHNALINAIVYTVGSVALTLIIGIGTALILNRTFVGERFATGLLLSPYLIPTVGAIIVFRWFFNGLTGIANYAFIQVGLIQDPIAWFSNPRYAMPVLILISGWRLYPFVTMLVLAKLQTIPKEYYEAADLMGASRTRQFISITLPQLRSVLFVAILLRMLWTFNLFDIIWLGTEGGPGTATETLPIMAYRLTFNGLDLGAGAAVAVLAFVVLATGTMLYFRLYSVEEEGATHA